MLGCILAVYLQRGAVCYILVLSLSTFYTSCACYVVVQRCAAYNILVFQRAVALLLFMCGLFRGAHMSLAPRARTLLGGLGQATLSFFAVATLLFVFFCECPEFCDLAKQRRKIFWGVSEVGKDDFSLYFFWRCVVFLVFYFSSAAMARRDPRAPRPSQPGPAQQGTATHRAEKTGNAQHEGKSTTARRHHHQAQNSTANQQHNTAQHDRPQEGKTSTDSTATRQQSTTAQHHATTQHQRTRHREAGHHSKPHQPQGSRTRGQTGTPTPKHATSRPPRATRPSTATQHTEENSTTHSSAPQHQAPATARTTRTAQRKRTSTAKHSTAQSGEDRERTAQHPRTHTAQSRAANNSAHHHTTTKHTQHRAHSAEEHRKTQRRRAQGPRATGSATGHGTTGSGTKRAQQSNTAHNSTTPGGTTRSSAAQHCTQGHTAQHSTRHTAPSGSDENRETQRGGGGGGQQPPGSSQRPGGKHERGESARRAEKREANKANNAQRRGPGHPGPETREIQRQRGYTTQENKKKQKKKERSTEPQRRKTGDTKGGGGAATTSKKPTARRDTEKRGESARRAGQRKAHKTNETQRQGPGRPGPETRESRRQRGRRKEGKKNESKAPSGSKNSKTQRGGGGGTAREQVTARQHQRGESTRRAKKREANKTNNTQRQGPGHPGPEAKESKRQRGRRGDNNGGTEKKSKRGRGRQTKDQDRGNASPEGAQQSRKTKEKVRRTRTRPGGRPARPGQEQQAHAHTRGTRAWRPPTRNGRCRCPHETAAVHRPSPPLNDGRHRKPDASVTGSTHANHRSARSPRPTPEGPARDNPIAGPRTGTTRSEPSAPASAGACGRHNEPGSQPASACPAQPPSKAGGANPRGGERHHGVGKADRSTESDRTGRGAAHHAGPRGTPERHATGHNQGTRTGAKQQRPPGAANLESAHNTHPTTVREQVPGNTSRLPDGRVRARRVPSPYRLQSAAVRIDECAPGGYPAPTGYEQPPSGWTSARPEGTQPLPVTNSRRPDGLVSAPQRRPAHATPHTQPKAQHTERARA